MSSSTIHGPFFDGFFEINGVNLSNDCNSFTITESAVVLANHAHGDTVELQRPGLLQWTISGQFFTDFGAGKSHATLTDIYRDRTAFIVRARADATAAVSTTNPQWSGSAYLTELTEIQGTHGDNLMTNFTCVANSALTVETT